ncbi:uncharacterized protein BO80DRAFT_437267 [Aspergillus ibericus CBS 121593]|uniref:Hydrophobin n=1 Tax=Aspergillus ibericus CBS 121593 TaxID=1448316 RepID=A0A395GRY6_9EURO|nr:hypothetical protein BO80DRAFT_437267 [Aspergillus ibericus CBS 121593]RAK98176.1 hypothetical protein BO80DRAFT_437267 [Aspergillus ibericus CBS 121593]
MQFTILTLALAAATATATTLSDSPALKDAAAGKCDVGNISCCNPSNSVKTDGVLNGLLGWGVISGLVNDEGSACASTNLIDELGLLSLVKDTPDGPVCQNIIACCPGKDSTCVAIGGTDGSDSGSSN